MAVFHHEGGYELSDDIERFDLDTIEAFLASTSWGASRKPGVTRQSVHGSTGFSLYNGEGRTIGFARVISDYTLFAWLGDVFVESSHRGLGLGRWMIDVILNQSQVKNIQIGNCRPIPLSHSIKNSDLTYSMGMGVS